VARLTPTAYVLSAATWQEIELEQDGNNRYYGGGPFALTTPRLWGLPVVLSEALPTGYGLVGDFRQAVVWDREQATIQVSDSHADFFIRNLVAILAEMRAAFGVLRPNAFVEIDVVA
jgi:HK97 family phage major capsid protein